MATRAHTEFDPAFMGVRLALTRGEGDRRFVAQWGPPDFRLTEPEEGPGDRDWLRLQEDDARAIYEALADYFGHSGHDIRALRKDYDAERARVDRLINHFTGFQG